MEADTAWSSPIVPIHKGILKTGRHLADPSKKQKSDYTLILDICERKFTAQQASIANVQDVIDSIGAVKQNWFTSLDMPSGYFLQALHPNSV